MSKPRKRPLATYPGHIAVAGEPDYEQPRCPECKSLDITFNTSDMKVAALSFAVVGIPLPGLGKKDFWHCNDCGINWIDDASE